LWLGILPGVAVILGGLVRSAANDRITGIVGASLGLLSGSWLVVGVTLTALWQATGPSPAAMSITAQIGLFYDVGAVITAVAAFAAGSMTVRSVRDITDRTDATARAAR